jgi:hypothetical protein
MISNLHLALHNRSTEPGNCVVLNYELVHHCPRLDNPEDIISRCNARPYSDTGGDAKRSRKEEQDVITTPVKRRAGKGKSREVNDEDKVDEPVDEAVESDSEAEGSGDEGKDKNMVCNMRLTI